MFRGFVGGGMLNRTFTVHYCLFCMAVYFSRSRLYFCSTRRSRKDWNAIRSCLLDFYQGLLAWVVRRVFFFCNFYCIFTFSLFLATTFNLAFKISLALTPKGVKNKKRINENPKLLFVFLNIVKQMVPCKSTAEKVLFEWSHHRISSTDSKVRTTLHVSMIDSGSERINEEQTSHVKLNPLLFNRFIISV